MNTSWVCVDASLVVPLLMEHSGERLEAQWAEWEADGYRFAAPSLLRYEVSNALYQYEKVGRLRGEVVDNALRAVLALPVQIFTDPLLHMTAVQMARRFSLPAAYDAHYLALADRLGAELWTLDQRLARAVEGEFSWVRVWQA